MDGGDARRSRQPAQRRRRREGARPQPLHHASARPVRRRAGARPGRTALVLVSKGLLLGRYGSPGRGGAHARPDWKYFSPDPRTLERQQAFHEALNSANVSVYAIDPTPLAQLLRESGGTAITDQMLGGGPGPAADPAEVPETDLSANPERPGSTRDDLGNALRHAAAAIPIRELGIRLDGEGRAHHPLVVHAAVLDGEGDLVEELHESFQVPAADGAGQPRTEEPPAEERIVFRHEWTLDREGRDLRLLVVDDATGRMAATAVEIEPLPSPDDGWATGDLVLVQQREGTPVPVVGGRIDEGAEAFAWLEIYGGVWPILEGQVRRLEPGGGALEIFPLPAVPAGPGLHRGSVPLPTLTPGEYELVLDVHDEDAGVERALTRRIRIVRAPGQDT